MPNEPIDFRPIDHVTSRRRDALRGKGCVLCGGDTSEFRNEISKRDFGITGCCQVCQDDMYGAD